MPDVAFLFPGQGSQAPGMGRDLARAYPEARAVFEEADQVLGFPLSQLCFEGSAEELKPTEIAQPALLTHSVAALRCVEAQGLKPSAVAGHSLGEYSALVAAGVLSFADALRMVQKRGLLMAKAAETRPGSMAAVLGMESSEVAALCKAVAAELQGQEVVVAANFNAPGQVVISGSLEGVRAASEKAKSRGASRVIPLSVSGAFHSPLMEEAARGMAKELGEAAIGAAVVPVIANTTAGPVHSAPAIRAALEAQIVGSVRWEESIQCLAGMGVTHYLELGPGKALSGLVRKIIPGAITHNMGSPEGLDTLQSFLDQRN